MRMMMTEHMTDRTPYIWQIYCGVSGPFTKYQEEYRVLGNIRRIEVAAYQFRDRSYEANAREISRALIGVYA